MTARPAIGIVGAGIVGSALGVALDRAGRSVVAVSSARRSSAEALAARLGNRPAVTDPSGVAEAADLVILAIPDDSVRAVAGAIAWRAGQAVVHCSGVGTSDWLAAATDRGARAGSFHPLQTFAGIAEAIDLLPGTTFAIEAGDDLAADLADLAAAIGGRSIRLRPEDKPAYHLAAVLVSNYLVTLAQISTELWQAIGQTPDDARRALIPLIRGVVRSLEEVGLPDCLTGPVARGDLGTIDRHRRVLAALRPDLLDLYRELGQKTVPIALAKGRIDARRGEELSALFERCRPTASLT